jgi:methionine-rich copper-binding protein CopC
VSTGIVLDKSENAIWVNSEPSSITLHVKRTVSEQTIVRISDISGREMFSKKIDMDSGFSKISLPVSLVNGIYILSLTSENGTTRNLKFIR